jgi:cobalt-zinc-cadmium resistance protein CzcA
VVVVENIITILSQQQKNQHLPRLHLIYRATRQVAVPVTSGILIIIIVFIPLLSLQGLEGKLFAPVAQTIVYALGGSLLMSLSFIPVIASYLIRNTGHAEPWLPRTLQRVYQPCLQWSLAHGGMVMLFALLLFLLTIPVFMGIGSTFMPTLDEGDIVLQTEKLPSITLDQSVALDLKVQQAILQNIPEVEHIITGVGSDERGLDPRGLNDGYSFLVLKPQD